MFCVLLPLDRLSIDRKQFRDALEARGIGTGVSYERCICVRWAKIRRPRRAVPERRTHFPRDGVAAAARGMSDADVDRVCAAVAEVIAAGR
jgi:hypothetical protein